jgi:hypothetical protein
MYERVQFLIILYYMNKIVDKMTPEADSDDDFIPDLNATVEIDHSKLWRARLAVIHNDMLTNNVEEL